MADLDPLCIGAADLDTSIPPELMVSTYQLGRYTPAQATCGMNFGIRVSSTVDCHCNEL